MRAVYGDQLAYFPELMEYYNIFIMRPLAAGGFAPREPYKKVRGYFTRNIGGDAGDPDETFSEFDKAQFFAYNRIPKEAIGQGMYLEVDGDIFKFTRTNDYTREGAFIIYQLLLVVGPTDQQVEDLQVPRRIGSDY